MSRLTPAYIALVKILAAAAVEEFFSEIEKGRPPAGENSGRPKKGTEADAYPRPRRSRNKAL
jgi:hypothetical protein